MDKKIDKKKVRAMGDCKKIEKLISLYHFGELSATEQKLVEIHIESCKRCAADLKEGQDALNFMNQKSVPQMSDQFWGEYDIGLTEKINKRKAASSQGFLSGFNTLKTTLLNLFVLPDYKYTRRFSYVCIVLLSAALFLYTDQNRVPDSYENSVAGPVYEIPDREIVGRPDGIKNQVIAETGPGLIEIMPIPMLEVQTVQDSRLNKNLLSLEESLLLQEMILLSELGEEMNLALNDSDILKRLEMIDSLKSI